MAAAGFSCPHISGKPPQSHAVPCRQGGALFSPSSHPPHFEKQREQAERIQNNHSAWRKEERRSNAQSRGGPPHPYPKYPPLHPSPLSLASSLHPLHPPEGKLCASDQPSSSKGRSELLLSSNPARPWVFPLARVPTPFHISRTRGSQAPQAMTGLFLILAAPPAQVIAARPDRSQ